MVVLEDLNTFDVVVMSIGVRVDDLASSHIEVSQHKVISSWIEVVLKVLQGIHSFPVVLECPQMEFLFGIHNLNDSTLEANCHHCCVCSHAEGADIVPKGTDLLDNLFLEGVVEVNRPSKWVEEMLLGIAIWGQGRDGVGEAVDLFALVLFPEALLAGEFVPGVGRLEGLQLVEG